MRDLLTESERLKAVSKNNLAGIGFDD